MKTLNREQTIQINGGIDCDDAIDVFLENPTHINWRVVMSVC